MNVKLLDLADIYRSLNPTAAGTHSVKVYVEYSPRQIMCWATGKKVSSDVSETED